MTPQDIFQTIREELEAGIKLPKCQKCGCMQQTLQQLAAVLPTIRTQDALALHQEVSSWLEHMRAIRYVCLGCEHCYPAVAQNALVQAFPMLGHALVLNCEFQLRKAWFEVHPGRGLDSRCAPPNTSGLTTGSLHLHLRRMRSPH